MKKVLSIILTVFCIGVSSVYADNDKSKQCQIPINMKKNAFQTGIERTIDQYVDAYLLLDSGTINVDFYGIGEGDAYLIDANNEVIDSASILAGMSNVTLNVSNADGNYCLVIYCSNYYGEGYFTLE